MPNIGRVEYPEYKDAIFALAQIRGSLDGIRLEELDSKGNVQGTVEGADLEQIIAEIRGIGGASVLLHDAGRTLRRYE